MMNRRVSAPPSISAQKAPELPTVNQGFDLGELLRVHHLNCGTFTPTARLRLITHVLACEFSGGVVLVDIGLGHRDFQDPWHRLGRSTKSLHPALDAAESAISRLNTLGLSDGVKYIVATHLDYDHVGGASDFPDVPVITSSVERDAAFSRTSFREKMRYRPPHLNELKSRLVTASEPNATLVALPFGLSGVPLDFSETLWMIPMPGHTRGHCAIAINDRRNNQWLIHAGDAFFHQNSIAATSDTGKPAPRVLRVAEQFLAMNRGAVRDNHVRLREAAAWGAEVICSHDAGTFPSRW